MQTESIFSQLDRAYKLGKKARQEGRERTENPYSCKRTNSRTHYPHGSWVRGWLSVNNQKGQHAS